MLVTWIWCVTMYSWIQLNNYASICSWEYFKRRCSMNSPPMIDNCSTNVFDWTNCIWKDTNLFNLLKIIMQNWLWRILNDMWSMTRLIRFQSSHCSVLFNHKVQSKKSKKFHKTPKMLSHFKTSIVKTSVCLDKKIVYLL